MDSILSTFLSSSKLRKALAANEFRSAYAALHYLIRQIAMLPPKVPGRHFCLSIARCAIILLIAIRLCSLYHSRNFVKPAHVPQNNFDNVIGASMHQSV
jgi:hypothetical protein